MSGSVSNKSNLKQIPVSGSNNSSDQLSWEMKNMNEMRNYRAQNVHYYRNPNATPSNILNSPDNSLDDRTWERALNQQLNGVANNVAPNVNISENIVFDDNEGVAGNGTWNNHGQRLVTGCSPTSSQSSGNASGGTESARNRVIGGLHIADLQGSPRRLGSVHLNDTSPTDQGYGIFKTGNNPRRPPGFPKRIISDKPSEPAPTPRKLDSPTEDPPFDYLYEFSETRKVLEEFFTPQQQQQLQQHQLLQFQQQSKRQHVQQALPEFDDIDFDSQNSSAYIGQRLAVLKQQQQQQHYEHQLQQQYENQNIVYRETPEAPVKRSYYESEVSVPSDEHHYYSSTHQQSRNFTLSPETTDYDSNCGDLDSEFSLKYIGSDLSELNGAPDIGRLYSSMPVLEDGLSSGHASDTENNNPSVQLEMDSTNKMSVSMGQATVKYPLGISSIQTSLYNYKQNKQEVESEIEHVTEVTGIEEDVDGEVENALKDIRATMLRSKALTVNINEALGVTVESPEMIRKTSKTNNNLSSKDSLTSGENLLKLEDEEADTDLETDRLLGIQRLEELQGGFDDNKNIRKIRCANGQILRSPVVHVTKTHTALRHGVGTQALSSPSGSPTNLDGEEIGEHHQDFNSPSKLLSAKTKSPTTKDTKKRNKEGLLEPAVLIEGVLFRARYLGSTQLVCEGQPTKSTRMMQAEEAVSRIKAPDGETQPSTEVDLFISTEKIMVLNTDLKEIMMDHALRTISYIADIGDLVVLMARRRFIQTDNDSSAEQSESTPPPSVKNRTPKMICHIFESEEAQFIAQSIGQAFQVAYMEFLKANGIEDHSFMKEMDYQEVLNSQEIFGDELEIFAKKELQKEVVVPKTKGEILGVVIVESGWGSMLPTVVIANLASTGAAARCGQLNIGDQIIAINGLSLVGLPLSQCQTYIKNTKNQTAVKFTVVPCAPVVEVKIKRPNTKYQLGFSVQNGVICSLLRGGIAERGGVRVGHRIIEINNQSVVAVPHEKIVNLLATSVGEILMKTMPTSMFRLLTGQENPLFI